VRQRLTAQGAEVRTMSPAEFAVFFEKERRNWAGWWRRAASRSTEAGMDKHRVLLNGRLLPGVEAGWRPTTTCTCCRRARSARLPGRPRTRVRGVVTSAGPGADAALIDALPELRVISTSASGSTRIDLAAAARRGIPWATRPTC
jgi:hypothetical protein